jgi:hypothetical protein
VQLVLNGMVIREKHTARNLSRQTILSPHHVMKKVEILQIGTRAVIGKRSTKITPLRNLFYCSHRWLSLKFILKMLGSNSKISIEAFGGPRYRV